MRKANAMAERDVYHEPEDRILLRTEDVYQTESPDIIAEYSETLLGIVADFKNSGIPEGTNAQSMVGKSKRGEVACRLFARINQDTGIIEAAGFKARGCLAMTACASAACMLIEGKTVGDALEVGAEDIRAFVDGVPASKVHALYFAACAIRALLGDYLVRRGATLSELDQAVPCDEAGISCIMAEHCSLRQTRLELMMDEEEALRREREGEACAEVFDLVRARTAHGKLTSSREWGDLVPAHLMPGEFQEMILGLLDQQVDEPPVSDEPRGRSAYANRGVGIPRLFSHEPEEPIVMPETRRAIPRPVVEESDENEELELDVPDGYELRQVDGEWALVELAEKSVPKPGRKPDATGIASMEGLERVYLYDTTTMKRQFAHWAFMAAEDDPLATFIECVREDSRIYPRPMAESSFANEPFCMDEEEVRAAFARAQEAPEFQDIGRVDASNGDVYYYSSRYLSNEHAQSLAEWQSVERLWNV